jgi:U2-associated protein SR140
VDDDDDVDGEPMVEDDDVDGEPMVEDDEDVDGEPMVEDPPEAEKEPEREKVEEKKEEQEEEDRKPSLGFGGMAGFKIGSATTAGGGPKRKRPKAEDMFADDYD